MFPFYLSAGGSAFGPDDRTRLARVERKLDAIIKNMGIEVYELSDEVRRLADAGYKVEAIKTHRTETGAGLAEAKHAVDAYLAAPDPRAQS